MAKKIKTVDELDHLIDEQLDVSATANLAGNHIEATAAARLAAAAIEIRRIRATEQRRS
jgi:hypothetical protein